MPASGGKGQVYAGDAVEGTTAACSYVLPQPSQHVRCADANVILFKDTSLVSASAPMTVERFEVAGKNFNRRGDLSGRRRVISLIFSPGMMVRAAAEIAIVR